MLLLLLFELFFFYYLTFQVVKFFISLTAAEVKDTRITHFVS